ncbi:Peptidyl-prolyl cis-trans isomerase FKBP65 [Galdieria sulphuraria]|nr:Peptidyl-prolyl cis-trans isomerase FKBP65 [Galdieria sulphuraria]
MKKSAKLRLVCRDERIRVAGLPFQIPHDIDCVEYELELIRWNKVEDVSKDGGVVKKIVKEGEGLQYSKDNRREIQLGSHCRRWCREKAVLTVAPNYAFKEAGIVPPEGVSKDSTVIVELELEEKIENALRTKDKGNELFKSGRYKLAKKKYEKVVNNLEFDVKNKSDLNAEQKQQGKSILLQTYLNLAACEEKFCNSNGVLKQCNKALEIDSVNVKALFRRASAYLRSSEVLLAEKDLKRALELDPSNVALKKKMRELRQVKAEQDAKDRRLFGNMFSRLGQIEDDIRKSNDETKGKEITAS